MFNMKSLYEVLKISYRQVTIKLIINQTQLVYPLVMNPNETDSV